MLNGTWDSLLRWAHEKWLFLEHHNYCFGGSLYCTALFLEPQCLWSIPYLNTGSLNFGFWGEQCVDRNGALLNWGWFIFCKGDRHLDTGICVVSWLGGVGVNMEFSPCNSHCNHNLSGSPSPFPSHSSAILMTDYSWKEKERDLSNLYPFFSNNQKEFPIKNRCISHPICWIIMIRQNVSAFFSSLQIEIGFLPMC